MVSWFFDGAMRAKENMEKDRQIYEEIVKNAQEPRLIVRVYEWLNPSITLGASQDEGILNLKKIEDDGVEWVRRMTGGRAVYHRDEITYSVAASMAHRVYGGGLYDSYKQIALALSGFLEDIGLHAEIARSKLSTTSEHQNCFSAPSMYEIAYQGKKIIGSAQKRGRLGLLQHGSIPLRFHQGHLNHYLLSPKNEDTESAYASLSDFIPHYSIDDLKRRLLEHLKRLDV